MVNYTTKSLNHDELFHVSRTGWRRVAGRLLSNIFLYQTSNLMSILYLFVSRKLQLFIKLGTSGLLNILIYLEMFLWYILNTPNFNYELSCILLILLFYHSAFFLLTFKCVAREKDFNKYLLSSESSWILTVLNKTKICKIKSLLFGGVSFCVDVIL